MGLYDYDEDGAGPHFSIPGMTDAEQIRGLRPRVGDISPHHNQNSRWGDVFRLDPGKRANPISTQMFDQNIPIAYQLRFALRETGPFTPGLPGAIDGVRVQLLKSIDLKAGEANEEFTLFGGNAQPSCQIICRKLSVILTSLVGEGGANVFCQVAACVVTNVDCDELRGMGNGYSRITQQEFIQTQATPVIIALAPNANRAQFFVQNLSSDSDVYIQWGDNVAVGPPAVAVMVLPQGISAIYESPVGAWTGEVTISFSNGSGDGGALITEGSF